MVRLKESLLVRRLLVAAFLLGVSACFAEVLRISEVVAADGDEVELMTLKGDDWEEEADLNGA
jgi:hypothetical protein